MEMRGSGVCAVSGHRPNRVAQGLNRSETGSLRTDLGENWPNLHGAQRRSSLVGISMNTDSPGGRSFPVSLRESFAEHTCFTGGDRHSSAYSGGPAPGPFFRPQGPKQRPPPQTYSTPPRRRGGRRLRRAPHRGRRARADAHVRRQRAEGGDQRRVGAVHRHAARRAPAPGRERPCGVAPWQDGLGRGGGPAGRGGVWGSARGCWGAAVERPASVGGAVSNACSARNSFGRGPAL